MVSCRGVNAEGSGGLASASARATSRRWRSGRVVWRPVTGSPDATSHVSVLEKASASPASGSTSARAVLRLTSRTAPEMISASSSSVSLGKVGGRGRLRGESLPSGTTDAGSFVGSTIPRYVSALMDDCQQILPLGERGGSAECRPPAVGLNVGVGSSIGVCARMVPGAVGGLSPRPITPAVAHLDDRVHRDGGRPSSTCGFCSKSE
mmetsp:Transcript_26130/g.78509  ORF Transcript_26130/g.78509 Transcript_26130/m.78509 type:complete len:207 (+) Transcript_26130:1267-1887(+)